MNNDLLTLWLLQIFEMFSTTTKILSRIIVLQQFLFGLNVAYNDLEKLDMAGFDTLSMKDRCTSIGLG